MLGVDQNHCHDGHESVMQTLRDSHEVFVTLDTCCVSYLLRRSVMNLLRSVNNTVHDIEWFLPLFVSNIDFE